jgi:UPF0271 protein
VTGGRQVDLNSDLGEGFGRWELGDDDALLDVVTSANVACGFHAGDGVTMRRVCERAVERGVAIGAQVGYRDLPGFGRRFIDIEPYALTQDVLYQLGRCRRSRRSPARACATSSRTARSTTRSSPTRSRRRRSCRRCSTTTAPAGHGPARLGLAAAGRAGGPAVVREAFADRAYTAEGALVSRRLPGAVLHDADEIARRCVAMATGQPVADVDGGELRLSPDSICVHGDTPAPSRSPGGCAPSWSGPAWR